MIRSLATGGLLPLLPSTISIRGGFPYGQEGVFPWVGPLAQYKYWNGPISLLPPTIAPQNSAVRLFGRRGGFWWHWASVTACHVLSSINARASSLAWGTFLAVRHSFSLSKPRSCRFGTRGVLLIRALLRGGINSTAEDYFGIWARLISFVIPS